jgi:hypothetical protein
MDRLLLLLKLLSARAVPIPIAYSGRYQFNIRGAVDWTDHCTRFLLVLDRNLVSQGHLCPEG